MGCTTIERRKAVRHTPKVRKSTRNKRPCKTGNTSPHLCMHSCLCNFDELEHAGRQIPIQRLLCLATAGAEPPPDDGPNEVDQPRQPSFHELQGGVCLGGLCQAGSFLEGGKGNEMGKKQNHSSMCHDHAAVHHLPGGRGGGEEKITCKMSRDMVTHALIRRTLEHVTCAAPDQIAEEGKEDRVLIHCALLHVRRIHVSGNVATE